MTQPATAQKLTCFKAYDIRGRLGHDLDEDIAARIARGFVEALDARRVVIGRDTRQSSRALSDAVSGALVDSGVEVLDLGLSGTEEMYFAVSHLDACGGICVTASHNPMDYNGMKMVQRGSAPLGSASGLGRVQELAEAGQFRAPREGGFVRDVSDCRAAYVDRVLSFVDPATLAPLHILVNAGNGAAGPTFDAIADELAARGAKLTFTRLHHEPDPSFPNGIPNPLLAENQPVTANAVREAGADLGVAWDGDFDRCFFFDEKGDFIDGEYIVALLAGAFLADNPGAGIVHDPRVIWGTQDMVARAGGEAIQSRTGHAFIKQIMRETGAVYGGEMSAHHYFRDFMFCDSGMIPWLLVVKLLSLRGQPLSELVRELRSDFPSSGEINMYPADTKAAINRVISTYEPLANARDDTDGVSFSFDDWRFNLRSSNTEPVLRLNVEGRGNPELVRAKADEIRALIEQS
ncbi:MAG: phosphomannomutase [Paracoccus sp. (in: a-proteobacteria)]|nr:phosphomannomutase [Paracoccus sp. (in: a-proteobacteria)]